MSAVERAVRAARRRIAGQRLVERLAFAWMVALAASLAWLHLEPGRWWVPAALVGVATLVALARTLRDYPAPLAAALELDSRFKLDERLTAALELNPEQQATPVGEAVRTDAERHATGLRVGSRFPVRTPRVAWLATLFATLLAVLAFVWHPVTGTGLLASGETKPTETATKAADTTTPRANPFPPPNPKDADKPAAERLAALKAELDRIEREKKPGDPHRVADLTAAEDAARAIERESLDRLTRMEEQLKHLEELAQLPEFKDGAAKDVAAALSQADLQRAEKSLQELAKQAAENPNDPELRKQIEKLKDAIRKAGENADEREKLEKLIEQAKKDGRDAEGLKQELDRLKAEKSDKLGKLADKLDAAEKSLEKGDGKQAAQALQQAGEALQEIEGDAKAAQDAREQADRAAKMRAEGNGKSDDEDKERGPGTGTGGVSDQRLKGKEPDAPPKDTKLRVPFVDPKAATAPIPGAGGFGNKFTKTDPKALGPAIRQAAQTAPAAAAGQPLTPADRDAVREFFERLGKP